jgi:hypothetical protein
MWSPFVFALTGEQGTALRRVAASKVLTDSGYVRSLTQAKSCLQEFHQLGFLPIFDSTSRET